MNQSQPLGCRKGTTGKHTYGRGRGKPVRWRRSATYAGLDEAIGEEVGTYDVTGARGRCVLSISRG